MKQLPEEIKNVIEICCKNIKGLTKIEDIDKQKAILETVDGKATSLLKGMTQEQTRNQKQIDNETPEYDD